jgi:hypothetical protein
MGDGEAAEPVRERFFKRNGRVTESVWRSVTGGDMLSDGILICRLWFLCEAASRF